MATIPTLPPLPAYPATGTEAERSQWLALANLHMQAARLESESAMRDQLAALTAQFAQVYPPMGAMEFSQVLQLLGLFAERPTTPSAP